MPREFKCNFPAAIGEFGTNRLILLTKFVNRVKVMMKVNFCWHGYTACVYDVITCSNVIYYTVMRITYEIRQ